MVPAGIRVQLLIRFTAPTFGRPCHQPCWRDSTSRTRRWRAQHHFHPSWCPSTGMVTAQKLRQFLLSGLPHSGMEFSPKFPGSAPFSMKVEGIGFAPHSRAPAPLPVPFLIQGGVSANHVHGCGRFKALGRFAQFIAVCRRVKRHKHVRVSHIPPNLVVEPRCLRDLLETV